jgi:hypothetical protein
MSASIALPMPVPPSRSQLVRVPATMVARGIVCGDRYPFLHETVLHSRPLRRLWSEFGIEEVAE